VYQLYRGGRRVEFRLWYAKAFACGIDEQRPHAFAAVEYGIAHRLVQPAGLDFGSGQHAVELFCHAVGVLINALLEVSWHQVLGGVKSAL
jgi:hypothetical protein